VYFGTLQLCNFTTLRLRNYANANYLQLCSFAALQLCSFAALHSAPCAGLHFHDLQSFKPAKLQSAAQLSPAQLCKRPTLQSSERPTPQLCSFAALHDASKPRGRKAGGRGLQLCSFANMLRTRASTRLKCQGTRP